MIKRTGFHHVALRAQHLEQSIEFYTKLGCSVIRSWGEGDGRGVMLHMGGGNNLEMFAGGTAQAEEHPRFEHIALKCDDVDADYQAALEAGATSQVEPKDGSLGGVLPIRIAFVVGPNQEVIEFFQEK